MEAGNPYNASFDPYAQNVTVLAPDGVTTIIAPLGGIFATQRTASITGIVFGVQVGLSALLLLALTMMTKPNKLKSAICLLNTLALMLALVRGVLQLLQVTGPFYNYYNWIAIFYVNVAAAERLSVAVEIISTCLDIVIQLSLLLQVRIVCVTLRTLWLRVVTGLSVLVIVVFAGVRFCLMVINIKYNVLTVGDTSLAQFDLIDVLASVSNITLMINIIFFSTIFCVKLAHAIVRRHQLGITQFGPTQIIFVMGCQTLVIPAIFGAVTYIGLKNELVHSFMAVLVAIFLPLSAIWASTNVNNSNNNIAAPFLRSGRASTPQGTSNRSDGMDRLPSTISTPETLTNNTASSTSSKDQGSRIAVRPRDSIDLELEMLDRTINVTRTYSINAA